MPLGALSNHIMAKIDCSNATMPFAGTAYLAL